MKRLKKGFTLAEVLITLAIIGVVAAIVMPSIMANYQYKTIGVKMGKFVSTTEGAARAFIVNEGNFNNENILTFLDESFIVKQFEPAEGTAITAFPDSLGTATLPAGGDALVSTAANPVALLKDGTGIQVFADRTAFADTNGNNHLTLFPVEKYGQVAFSVAFSPNVQGLPATAHRSFNFAVTELGYVLPHESDACAWDIYNADFNTTPRMFANTTSCFRNTGTGTGSGSGS